MPPPHRSRRTLLTHRAPTSGHDLEPTVRDRDAAASGWAANAPRSASSSATSACAAGFAAAGSAASGRAHAVMKGLHRGEWRPGRLELYLDGWLRASSTAAATNTSAWGWGFSTSQDFNGDIALIACFASSWTPAMVRRWHADPFGFLRPWNELPALMGSAPPATPPSTGTGVVVCIMGVNVHLSHSEFSRDRKARDQSCRRTTDFSSRSISPSRSSSASVR